MVIVDELRKEYHFKVIKSTHKEIDIAHIFMQEVFRLNGKPKNIILDQEAKFASKFWIALFVCLQIELAFSIVYHLQMNGKSERINKVLEYMLRMYAMCHPKRWEYFLPLVKFSYNNGYHESLKMSPFEALYGRKCSAPIIWNDLMRRVVLGHNMLK